VNRSENAGTLDESRGVQHFYAEVLHDLLFRNVLHQEMSVLVVCGGPADRDVLLRCGFQHVVISNLDVRTNGSEFHPFAWSRQDAENLSFEANSFDFCVVHSGLHHCYSPHRAFLEMYRVARKGVLMFEPYDNFVTRLGVLLKFGQEYEHAAVFYNDCSYGGVRNSSVPNYVYRWTEQEIVKTINSCAPYGKHTFRFFYKTRFPWVQLRGRTNRMFYYTILLLYPAIKAVNLVLPKQSNNFAALVVKPELPRDLHPWLLWESNTLRVNSLWLTERYSKKHCDAQLTETPEKPEGPAR
jgi:ubiquinone/menaquinone biosynthesis C-methylase UbiE